MSPTVSRKTLKTENMGRRSSANSKLGGVDVMDALQHAISIIEKEMAKKTCFLAEGHRHTQHDQHHGSTHHKESLIATSLQHTVSIRKRVTEHVTDVTRGNTTALVVIEQFL